MRFTAKHPLIRAAERAEAALHRLDQPEGKSFLAPAGEITDNAIGTDVGQSTVQFAGGLRRVHAFEQASASSLSFMGCSTCVDCRIPFEDNAIKLFLERNRWAQLA
jgi:hypothetical protein